MGKILAACGNDCSICPRHMPKSDEDLHKTAELWYRIGYRNSIVSNEKISCFGCTADNQCRYAIVSCTTQNRIENCGRCSHYPCDKIKNAFMQTMEFEPHCKKYCTAIEYDIIKRAFFEKEKNLNAIANLKK